MISRLLIIALLLSLLVGCKSYEFKARNKSELAKVCLGEFPPDNKPIDRVIDTIYQDRIEWIEVDCDTIGKIEVPHVCKEKIVTETIYVNDPRQTYLIQNLEGKLELADERLKQANELNKERLRELKETHKEELGILEEKHKVSSRLLKKQRNNYLFILIAIGGLIAVRLLRMFKIL